MQIKILIVPALIILSFILGIGFIKPDYDTLMQKRAELAQKQSQVSMIETTKENIATLDRQLTEKSDLEGFVSRYYPETLDQERIIDSFNFMATQSGLIISSMEMKEIIKPDKEEGLGVGGPLTSVPGDGTGQVSGPPVDPAAALAATTPIFKTPKPVLYVARVQVKGSYENIKNFMDRLAHMDRANNLVLVSIADNKQQTDGETSDQTQLVGTFEAQFGYLKLTNGESALSMPIFSQSSLPVTQLEQVKEWATSAVPALTVSQSGKANPFQ